MADEPIYDMTDTWSQAGTKHTAIKMNVTDAASTTDSALLELQVGGNSRFTAGKDGSLTLAGTLRTLQAALASLPSASAQGAGAVAYAAGLGLVVSNGTAWQLVGVGGRQAPANIDTLFESGTYSLGEQASYTTLPVAPDTSTPALLFVSRHGAATTGDPIVVQFYIAGIAGTFARAYRSEGAAARAWTAWTRVGPREATLAELLAGSSLERFVSPGRVADFVKFSEIVVAATGPVNVDFNTIRPNATIRLQASATLAAATNGLEGQSGILRLQQDGTGNRTLAFNAYWDFGPAGAPTLSTAANVVDHVFYAIEPGATKAICSFRKGS